MLQNVYLYVVANGGFGSMLLLSIGLRVIGDGDTLYYPSVLHCCSLYSINNPLVGLKSTPCLSVENEQRNSMCCKPNHGSGFFWYKKILSLERHLGSVTTLVPIVLSIAISSAFVLKMHKHSADVCRPVLPVCTFLAKGASQSSDNHHQVYP